MADTLDVLTLNEGKSAINLPTSNTSYDTELAMFITAVSRRMDVIIGPVVNRTVTDERHDGGEGYIELRYTPVSSVTTVKEYDRSGALVTLTAETDTVKQADGYILHSEYVRSWDILRRNSGGSYLFTPGENNVLVTYVAGRAAATANVDALYKLGAGAILKRLWQREAAKWAQTPGAFGDDTDGLNFFFRVVDPMIAEWFPDEVKPSVA